MILLLKDNIVDTNNIYTVYNYKYDFFKVLYKYPYIIINGIPLSVKYYKYILKNGFIYIYICNRECLNLLQKIETKLKSNIIKYNTYEKTNYIIVKDIKNVFPKLYKNTDNVNISIIKVKKINNYYVSIINII